MAGEPSAILQNGCSSISTSSQQEPSPGDVLRLMFVKPGADGNGGMEIDSVECGSNGPPLDEDPTFVGTGTR